MLQLVSALVSVCLDRTCPYACVLGWLRNRFSTRWATRRTCLLFDRRCVSVLCTVCVVLVGLLKGGVVFYSVLVLFRTL